MKFGNRNIKWQSMRIIIVALFWFLCHNVYGQVDTIQWQRKSSFPISSLSAYEFGSFLIDSNFYVAGGWLGAPGVTFSNNVWRYHISTDTWYQMNNLPFGGASSSASFSLNGKGYFLTSSDSVNSYNCDIIFWEYDPVIDSWIRKTNFPGNPRQNSSSFTFGGKGYVGQTSGCSLIDSHFWEYDPILDNWTEVATLPDSQVAGSTAVAVAPDYAYLFAGQEGNTVFLKDVWRYNITINQWDSIGQMPGFGRWSGVFWGFDSAIIGGGGDVSPSDTTYNWYPANDFYYYNIFANSWTPVVFENFMDSVVYGASFVWNKTAFYFGGPTNMLETTRNVGMWSFDASKFYPDSTVGIAEVKPDINFKVYPNPTSQENGFSISTSEDGSVLFYDALGRTLDERKLVHGLNQIRLTTDEEVIFYRATLSGGVTENGKVVMVYP